MTNPTEPIFFTLSLSKIITIALGSSLLTAVFSQLFGLLRDFQKERREARYLALRVAVVLEGFSIACANIISDNKTYARAEECFGSTRSQLPPAPEYPTDVDWKSLSPDLSAQALSFINEIPLSAHAIEFMYDVEPELVPPECSKHAGKCGYRAWQIAAGLRKKYDLPVYDPTLFSWDMVTTLKLKHDEAMK